jgi:hypothetical protein
MLQALDLEKAGRGWKSCLRTIVELMLKEKD